MMSGKKRNLAAPCGLYCGACMIYLANKNKDVKLLDQMKKRVTQRFSELKEVGQMQGMPPPAKDCDLTQLKKEIAEGKEYMCCEGCLSEVVALPCRICGFRSCAQEKGLTNCSECPDMPCQWVKDFANDGMPHHGEVLTNLQRQREIGIEKWLDEQEKRWRCIQCGSSLTWYDTKCPDCQAAQPQTFDTSPF